MGAGQAGPIAIPASLVNALDLMPHPSTLVAVISVYEQGAKKHGGPRGWRKDGTTKAQIIAKIERHAAKWRYERRDPDSGQNHAAHIAALGLVLLEMETLP